MINVLVVGVVSVVVGVTASQEAISSQPVSVSDNIENARWVDFQNEYPASHLCKKTEITLWTCERKKKTYSLCSSQDIPERNGYIRYRVGDAKQVTFEYPADERHPKGVFEYDLGGNGNAWITFRNSDYKYELYDSLRGDSSIVVWKESSNHIVSEISCNNPNQTLQLNYTIKLMRSAGIIDREQ